MLLTKRNELILEEHGGVWEAPPPLIDGWAQDQRARKMLPLLRAAFDDRYPTEGWLWKDPRVCLTLPLWLQVWESPPPLAVLVCRHPIAVARSLHARNEFSWGHSLELWERYNAAALENLRGLPLLVRSYDRVFADPLGFVENLRDELVSLGAVLDGSVSKAAASIKPSLRRNEATQRDLAMLDNPQRRLWDRLGDIAGGAPAG